MRTIAIINQKGGVGKTTTAVNLSAALAAMQRRVLLIDFDPQSHASLHLGVAPGHQERSIYDVLGGSCSLGEARRPAAEHLDVVGAHIDLSAAEVELAGEVGRELILRDKIGTLTDEYDYLLIDCPPSLGVLTLNALAAVEEVFIPLQPHFLALHGLSKLLETISVVSRRLNPRLRVSGIVFCQYESSTNLAAEVSRDVEEFFQQARDQGGPWSGAQPFPTRIRRNVRLAEAPSFGQSIFDYSPESNGAVDYQSLALEVLAQEAAAESPARGQRTAASATSAR